MSNIDISASSTTRPVALSESELRAQVQKAILTGSIKESWHARDERSYRNISIDDIQHMLRTEWKLKGKPAWSAQHHDWSYKVIGEDLDGDELTLVISIRSEPDAVLVITKW